MDAQLADRLTDVCDDAEIYEDYSGRGMYGKTTTGVVVESLTELMACVITCADFFVDLHGDPKFEVSNFRVDSMGHKTIIY